MVLVNSSKSNDSQVSYAKVSQQESRTLVAGHDVDVMLLVETTKETTHKSTDDATSCHEHTDGVLSCRQHADFTNDGRASFYSFGFNQTFKTRKCGIYYMHSCF